MQNNNLSALQKRRLFKRTQFLAKDTASRTLFASIYGMDGGVTPFSHGGQRIRVSYDRAMAVCATPIKWRIACYALCRDTTGRDYIKSMCLELAEPVKQDAINQALSHAHYDWMKQEVNTNHLLTLAWIATSGAEPSDDVAMKIFTELGGWKEFELAQKMDDGRFLTRRVGDADSNASSDPGSDA